MSASRFSRCRVLPIDLVVQIEVALPQRHRQPLQAVVERLGDAVEVGRTGDHFPTGIDSQFVHQRHHPAQDFRHPAAAPRGIHVDDPLAGQPLGQPAEPLDLLVADNLFVAVQQFHAALLGTGGASAAYC